MHANPICPSYPTVPHGMDGMNRGFINTYTLCMQIFSLYPIPLYHMGWVGLYQGFIHTQTGHANTIGPPYPTVPHGIGGTVPGIYTYTDWACKSYLSVLSLCTTWDVWDCTRASYIQTLGMQILSVRPIPLYHMGWVGLYQGFIHTHTVQANPICPSYPTVPHGMGRTVPGIHIYTDWACKSYMSVLSHCTAWDGRDCTRDSYIHRLGMQILSVCPIPLYHMGIHTYLHCAYNPICPSSPTVPHEMSRSKSMPNTWRQNS